MKKVISSLFLVSLFGLFFTSCKKDPTPEEPTGDGKPVIANLAVSPNASVKYGDVVTLSGKFTDETGLSTYTVTMSNAQGELSTVTNMLVGKEFNLNLSAVVPLPKNAQAGNVTIKVDLKNSGNATVTETLTLSGVAVPDLEKLYLDVGRLIEMEKVDDVYVVEDLIAANAVGKIYTKADKTGMFWGWANNAVTGLADGSIPIGKSEATTLIVSFNMKTFELVVEEGNSWEPIEDAIYIFGNISGHWMDGDITEEKEKMKMTGFASGDKKYWTWVPPASCDEPDCADGMWGNINPGRFCFKVGGKEEYIMFDGNGITTGASYDEQQRFPITAGGWVEFTLYYDGTNFNKVLLNADGKTLEYTAEGILVNGMQVPAAMSFGGGSLAKKEGSLWAFEGRVTLQKDQDVTASGIDLSMCRADFDVFIGDGNATWKVTGESAEYYVSIDPFLYDVYICNPAGYPDVIYMDSWGWHKFAGFPANNWNAGARLCLYRVDETSIYEAIFNDHGWGDIDGFTGDASFFASAFSETDIIISPELFNDLTPVPSKETTHFYKPLSDAGRGVAQYRKVSVDLKDGFTIDEENNLVPNSAVKYTAIFTDVTP